MSWEMLLAIVLPCVVVFLTVYFMLRQYFEQQTKMNLLSSRQSNDKSILPLRLQAYERLILFCERISIPDLVLRLKAPGTNAGELKSALLLAVQQEFEHNLTQQLYVSEELWHVMLMMKSKTMDMIINAAESLPSTSSAEDYALSLIHLASTENNTPSRIGIKAIKTETSLWS